MGFFLVFLSATGFATLAVFGKFAFADGLNLMSVLSWRFIVAASVLLPVLIIRRSWRIKPSLLVMALLLGAIGYAVQAALFFTALQKTSAAITSLLLYSYPTFVAIISRFVFKERLSNWRLLALLLSILGVVLTIPYDGTRIEILGAAVALASGVWYACYLSFGARRVQEIDPVSTTGILSIGAAVSFTLCGFLSGGIQIPPSPSSWLNILGIGVVATVLPIVCLFAAIKKLGVTRTSIMSTLEPVLTAVFGYVMLGEALSVLQVGGGMLIVLSAILLQVFG